MNQSWTKQQFQEIFSAQKERGKSLPIVNRTADKFTIIDKVGKPDTRHQKALEEAVAKIQASDIRPFVKDVILYGSCARGESEKAEKERKTFVKRAYLFGSYARREATEKSEHTVFQYTSYKTLISKQ